MTESVPAGSCSPAALQRVLEMVSDAVVVSDDGDRVVVFNPAAERLFGYRADEVVGCPVEVLLPGGVDTGSAVLRRSDGTAFAAEISLSAADGGDGFAVVVREVVPGPREKHQGDSNRGFSEALVETVGALVVLLDPTGRVEGFNAESERVTGFSREEVLGQMVWDVLVPSDRVREVRDIFERPVSGERYPNRRESDWLTASGERRLISWSNAALCDQSGQVVRLVVTGIDVTEERQATEALRRNEESSRLLAESAPVGIFLRDESGVIYSNPTTLRHLGLTEEEVLGDGWLSVVHPDDLDRVTEALQGRLDGDETLGLTYRIVRSDGRERWIQTHSVVADDLIHGRRVLGTSQDVTEQQEAIASLAAAEERFRAVFEASPLGITIRDLATGEFVGNQAFCDLIGRGIPGEPMTDDWRQLAHPDEWAAEIEAARRVEQGEVDAYTLVRRFARPDGTWVWAREHATRTWGRNPIGVGVVRDLTEEHRLEQDRDLRAAQVDSMLQAFPDVLFRLDRTGTVLEVAASEEARSGLLVSAEAQVGQRATGIFPGELGRRIQAAAEVSRRDRTVESMIYQRPGPDGFPVHREVRFVPLRNDEVMVVTRDIGERVRLQEQLVHSEKMQTLGRMAGGMAHNFNNVLAIVQGHAELLAGDGLLAPRSAKRVVAIRRAAERAADLVGDLMTLARPVSTNRVLLEVNEFIGELSDTVALLIGEDIEVRLRLAAASSTVRINPSRLEQVLLNLASNARDAMPEGGTLRIQTSEHDGSVVIEVSDTGVGMDSETLAQVFEPFFSTKGHAVGTGLGLATSYSTITQAEGSMTVSSTPGHGTRFTILLPAVSSPPAESEPDVELPEPVGDNPLQATILVVEDEQEVLDLLADMLRHAGHRILEAGCAEDALDLAATQPRIDLLVTDVVLGDLSGPELAAKLIEDRPGLPILFISGYAPAQEPTGVRINPERLIRKPFTQQQIQQRVNELLEPTAT